MGSIRKVHGKRRASGCAWGAGDVVSSCLRDPAMLCVVSLQIDIVFDVIITAFGREALVLCVCG